MRVPRQSRGFTYINYYLGIIYLNEGNKGSALQEWRSYLKKEPESARSLSLRKHMTLIQKSMAQDFAREAIQDEVALHANSTEPNSLAIFYFKNLGSERIDPLKKGLAAILITDISQVPGLNIVERIRMQALVAELELSDAGFASGDHSVKLGKLLRAEKVVHGNYSDLEGTNLQIASSLANVSEGIPTGSASANGDLQEFFTLEKVIAYGILKDLGYSEAQIPDSVKKIHTKNFAAFQSFSVGLDYFDNEEYEKAREHFQTALDHDPNFVIARDMMLITPLSALSVTGIVSALSSSAPSSSVAAGGMGLGAKAGLAVGAALGAGGGLAAVAGGGGGGGKEGQGGEIDPSAASKVCSPQSVNGSDPDANGAVHTRTFDLLKKAGIFSFIWDTGQIEDRVVVSYQNAVVFDSTCIAGNGTQAISYSGELTEIEVTTTANCKNPAQTGTFWQYSVGCP